MKSVADEFAQLRPELKERFEVLERRTERIYINLNSVLMQVAGNEQIFERRESASIALSPPNSVPSMIFIAKSPSRSDHRRRPDALNQDQ